MGDAREFDANAILCKVCKKRKAIVLCDAITGHSKYVGHPPRIDGIIDYKFPMESVITCDKPMCARCTTKVTEYMDLCPECAKGIK